MRQISQQSGYCAAKLYRLINYWLKQPTQFNIDFIKKCSYAVFDGTFLHRPNSIVAVMDGQKNQVIAGKFGVRENSIPELLEFFQPLKAQGLNSKSFTVDGNPQVIKVIRRLWPDAVIQRCLVHIQRQGLSWCRQTPKRKDAKELRKLFLRVTNIRNHIEREEFINSFLKWELKYGVEIDEKPEKGKVFSDIKRARSMVLKALPNMFHYLEDTHIPWSTNCIEGYYSRLKMNYRNHRGLSPLKLPDYFRWYFFLKPI